MYRTNAGQIITVFILFFVIFPFPVVAGELYDITGNALGGRKDFQRIISLYPAHTENLASLQAADLLVGVSTSDDYPEVIVGKQRFSYRDNPEKFIAASPDLILVRPMIVRAYAQLLSRLQEAGITVVSLQPRSVDEIYAYWRDLGALVGREEEAEKMIADFKQGLDGFTEKNRKTPESMRPRIYFESIHAKMKTIAPRSIAAFVLEHGGGHNIASDAVSRNNTNIASYGKEHILSHAASIDIYLAQNGRMNRVSKEDIVAEPGFGSIKAIQEEQVYLIDEKFVSRPTLRLLQGMDRVQEIIKEFQASH